MADSFDKFFADATRLPGPYPYQRELAADTWPDVLDIPTGLGKTAAVTLAWLYRRRVRCEPDTPRRLVWCLPMRVLVEQTRTNITRWLQNLDLLGGVGESGRVAVHVLMGGEPGLKDAHWARFPEQDAVLIGTQDMLLSRALMRGYGMSRYQWPVHFALLHHDTQWVFDEVQLMGTALSTSAQLEAFRQEFENRGESPPARTLWASATLRPEWLATVDFRQRVETGLAVQGLTAEDRQEVSGRLAAPKALEKAQAGLAGGRKADIDAYIAALADAVRAAHAPGSRTLVIVNRVERAQLLYRALSDQTAETVLVHARFRPPERVEREQRIGAAPGGDGQIVIATQAVEAGVDLDSRTLFTEIAPWSSLVQRFGRCNRAGKHRAASVYWLDIEGDDDTALPYTREEFADARERLTELRSASPEDLPGVEHGPAHRRVLRQRDFLDLFNTDPDLSGFDVDVSPYIRDAGSPQLQVFWRDFDDSPATDSPWPEREELCNASMGQVRAHLKALGKVRAWCWDPLDPGTDGRGSGRLRGRWRQLGHADELRPGQTVMLRAGDGGYDTDEGFRAGARGAVTDLHRGARDAESSGAEDLSNTKRWVSLSEHTADVVAAVDALTGALAVPAERRALLATAASWHDVGKAHEAFQRGIGAADDTDHGYWAKSPHGGRPNYRTVDADGQEQPRPGFRHELASALAWLEHNAGECAPADRDLIGYLIAAHHGRVRLGLRALPIEREPSGSEDDRPYARGVWHRDTLPAISLGDWAIPPTELHLDIMRLGHGPGGPSWSERTRRLLTEMGPFGLAWLEALLRIADWRASAAEDQETA